MWKVKFEGNQWKKNVEKKLKIINSKIFAFFLLEKCFFEYNE